MNPEIPEDIIKEILKRLPPRSVSKYRFVSKSWNSIIKDYSFQSLYRSHSKPSRHWIIFAHSESKKNGSRYNFLLSKDESFAAKNFQSLAFPSVQGFTNLAWCTIAASGDGVIVLRTSELPRMCLWNPSIGIYRCVDFPYEEAWTRGSMGSVMMGSGLDERSQDYKIVIIRKENNGQKKSSIYVYSLNTSSWSDFECTLDNMDSWSPQEARATNFRGACHWVIMIDREAILLCFNLDNQEFHYISVPPIVKTTKRHRLSTIVYKDMLSFWYAPKKRSVSESRLEGWAMKEYGNSSSWVQLLKVDFASGFYIFGRMYGADVDESLLFDSNPQNSRKDTANVSVYDPHHRVYKGQDECIYDMVKYEESLVLL